MKRLLRAAFLMVCAALCGTAHAQTCGGHADGSTWVQWAGTGAPYGTRAVPPSAAYPYGATQATRTTTYQTILCTAGVTSVQSTRLEQVDESWIAPKPNPAPSMLFGVRIGPGAQGVAATPAFASQFGVVVNLASDYLPRTDEATMLRFAGLLSATWKAAGYPAFMLAVPPFPDPAAGQPAYTMSAAAAGAYDDFWRQIGANIVAGGYPDAILRPMWEGNGTWFPWSGVADPALFVQVFDRMVTVLRSVPGQRFVFDWNIDWGRPAPATMYPGDAYVDRLGVDVYDNSYQPLTDAQQWAYMSGAGYSLNAFAAFAASHGKGLEFPEWGLGNRGDTPAFIAQMAALFAQTHTVAAVFWNENQSSLSGGANPASAAAFKAAFGAP